MKKKCEIISLGANCMPRSVLTRNGIKPSKSEGELSCPFDLAIHPITCVIKALEDNFITYFDGLYFESNKKHIFDFSTKRDVWKKTDGTRFNHDTDCGKNDFEKLKLRFQKRIENFNKILDSGAPILFVIYIKDEESRQYINKLYDTLQLRLRGGVFLLSVIDFNGITNEDFYPQIKVLNLPKPCENYFDTWYRSKFKKSSLGPYTEKCICEFVQNIINNEF